MKNLNEEYISLKKALFDKCYSSLNEKQREAVFTVNNPLLILAGAGSGKTTVLVKRIVYIMKYGNAYYSDFVPEFVDAAYIKEMRMALESKDIKSAENMLSDFAYNPCPCKAQAGASRGSQQRTDQPSACQHRRQ